MNKKLDEVNCIVKEVATANLSSSILSSVYSEPFIDSDGQEMLLIKIVLTPGSTESIEGNKVLNTLVEIREQLERHGEERFPLVEYTTEEELQKIGRR
jgi:hypothetical protein